jgi:hypothetical protein
MFSYRNAYTSGILLCLLLVLIVVGTPVVFSSTPFRPNGRKVAPVEVDVFHLA